MNLEIQGLSKTYSNGTKALQDVSLSIPPGMFGLLGPNGAGKSTLMRTISTLQEPDSGSISLGQLNVLTQKDQVRRILGYLPQEFGVYPKVSAWDLLDHFASLKGITNKSERRNTVSELLELTNLYQHRKKAIGGFSGGMKQRFGIAQALLGNPKLVIVDEPTAGLDPEERVRFHNLLSDIGRNIIVLLSTHIVSDVADLCSNMAVINQGKVLLSGKPLDMVDLIKGKIWQKFIEKEEVEEHQSQFQVISTRLVVGRTLIRAYSNESLAGFDQGEADLEDVYFAAIKGFLTLEPVA